MSIIEAGREFLKQSVELLDKFSFIGTSTVFVKLDYVVRNDISNITNSTFKILTSPYERIIYRMV